MEAYGLLRLAAGACPHCGPRAGDAVIYRSSRRSVTMRCEDCGLQWTMTAHMLAKAARRWADAVAGGPGEGIAAATADMLGAWAAAAGERRGRPKAGHDDARV